MASVYEIVTDRIVKLLDAGTVPWRRPFSAYGPGLIGAPRNAAGRRYRGMNWFLLSCAPHADPRFLTYRQAQELGGNVRKGEKGYPVLFWSRRAKDANGKWHDATSADEDCAILARYYTVFNAEQIDGADLPELANAPERHDWQPIDRAAAIVEQMPNRPEIVHAGLLGCYAPALDRVTMPERTYFPKPTDYYATLYHELGHATGHKSRLDRFAQRHALDGFGTDAYAKEELVAELTSAFLCADAGIDCATIDNQAAYIGGWVKRLKADPKMLPIAAAQAQRAADYIANRTAQAQPEQPEAIAA